MKQRIPSGYRVLRVGQRLRCGCDKYRDKDTGNWVTTGWKSGTRLTAEIIRVNGNYIRHIPAKRP